MAINRSALDFAAAARALGQAARVRGLIAPSFRCPPRLADVDRSVRRHAEGAVISVRTAHRAWPAIISDMIEGVIITNRLTSPAADQLRTELWNAAGFHGPLLRKVA
ncbi:MAG: hypothetical protein JWM12_3920 [Ilumatobacteraceae bacterium]|nr:hypothetical protein [Ilumatobacteraceae bacterium]